MKRATRRTTRQIFALPLALGLVTFAGLVLGLTGDGVRDVAAWLLLCLVPIAIAIALVRGGTRSPNS